MILKINLYLESDLKLKPGEVAEAASFIQRSMTEEILEIMNGEDLKYRLSPQGQKVKFKLLTREQVESKVFGTPKKTKTRPDPLLRASVETPISEGKVSVSQIESLVPEK